MLGQNFLFGFVCMDFIGFLVLLGWLLRGRSEEFVLWGFLVAFFYFWGAKLEIFLVSQIFVRRFGGLSVGVWYWIWFPSLWGAH